ncbi:MAG: hemerythrin domain-containing protein [Bacteroidota bacterium]|nr:hemerythrin domain-containing protein [Bacteroidota bacterium]
MKATEQLMQEHQGIMLMLNIMSKVVDKVEKVQELNIVHQEKIIEFLKVFADKCHHGKEEDILFPVLESKGVPRENGPIGVMLFEHKVGRGFIKEMIEAFEQFKTGDKNALSKISNSMRSYINLLTGHIHKENNILFPMGDRVLSDQLQTELYEKFEKLEEEKIGLGKHEEFHRMLKELKDIYL